MRQTDNDLDEDIVRGGQTSLHAVRMTGQLVRLMVFTCAFVLIAGIGWQLVSFAQKQRFSSGRLSGICEPAGHGGQMIICSPFPGWEEQPYRVRADDLRKGPAFVAAGRLYAQAVQGLRGTGMRRRLWRSACWFFLPRQPIPARGVRGAELVTSARLSKLAGRTYARTDAAPWQLAGVNWPKGGETLHTLITGSTGSGKTVAMLGLLDQIEARGGRAVIYDKMGSFVPHFFKPERDVILNPFDARAADWDIFCEARAETDFETMAAALIPHFKDTLIHSGQRRRGSYLPQARPLCGRQVSMRYMSWSIC